MGILWTTVTSKGDKILSISQWTQWILCYHLNFSDGRNDGIELARKLLSAIAKGNFKSKQQCRDFLAALIKQNNLNIDLDTLMGQIASVAGEARNYVYDGPSATSVPFDSSRFPGVDPQGARTVADHFAQDRSREALSQATGSAIWIRADRWQLAFSGLIRSSYDSPYGSGTLMHELLHKQAISGGFTHGQMTNALVSIGQDPATRILGHDRTGISDLLGRICF